MPAVRHGSRVRVDPPESREAVSGTPGSSAPKGIAALEEVWRSRTIVSDPADLDALREAAVPEFLEVLQQFISGVIELAEFRSRIDSLGKTRPYWGFGRAGQMFFNQLVKAAEPTELSTALRAALTKPDSSIDADGKIEGFLTAVDRFRERAQVIGATPPGRGRSNYFVSFFWELADREAWPIFYPNSRDVLEEYGLLDTTLPHPALYTAYNEVVQELKRALRATTWEVEHLLWVIGQVAPTTETVPGAEEEPALTTPEADLYASYRAQALYFPDELVTSLVLSLTTKRFVILGGISGTGKTQIALGLARYLDELSGDQLAATEAPTSDKDTAYIRLTAARLHRGRLSLDADVRARFDAHIGLPERGSGKRLRARLPDGSIELFRVNNIGLEDPNSHRVVLFTRKESQAWLVSHAKPGEYLRIDLRDQSEADMSLAVVGGEVTGEAVPVQRHELIAVRSDWTDPRGLLGYFQPAHKLVQPHLCSGPVATSRRRPRARVHPCP